MKTELKIRRLNPNAVLPAYQTEGSAAMDLRACLDVPVTLGAGERKLIPTGLAIELPNAEYVAILCARSGLAFKSGIALANGIGVIDSDYRGEIGVALLNQSGADYTVRPGDRIAQLMILPVAIAKITEVAALGETERGAGGFGSTGKA